MAYDLAGENNPILHRNCDVNIVRFMERTVPQVYKLKFCSNDQKFQKKFLKISFYCLEGVSVGFQGRQSSDDCICKNP